MSTTSVQYLQHVTNIEYLVETARVEQKQEKSSRNSTFVCTSVDAFSELQKIVKNSLKIASYVLYELKKHFFRHTFFVINRQFVMFGNTA